jgi:hypothetical protein
MLERRVDDVCELVDGYDHPRSHRNRLHALEGNAAAVGLARQVLRDRGRTELAVFDRVREWSSLLVAIGAVVIAVLR